VILEHLETNGKGMISWEEGGGGGTRPCPAAQHEVGQSTGENAAAEKVLAVLRSPIFFLA
jgi:hypothetical protein